MTYYILFPNETKENLIYDANILGESTKTTFYPNRGFYRFTRAINELNEESIIKIQLFDEQDKQYNVEQFLKLLSKLTISTHNR